MTDRSTTSNSATRTRVVVMPIVICVAIMLGSLCFLPIIDDALLWVVMAAVTIIVEAISAVSRRFNTPAGVIHLWQLLGVLAMSYGAGLSATRSLGIAGAWLPALKELFIHTSTVLRVSPAPLPPDPGVRWILTVVIGLVSVLADLLVISLANAAWSLAALLSMYLIPAITDTRDAPWWTFVAMASAYLLILLADQLIDSRQWTRNVTHDSAPTARLRGASGALAGMGTVFAIPALALSLVIGSALPTFGHVEIVTPRPHGEGPIQLTDPTLDLQKNLNDPSSAPVLSYTSQAKDGEYLRIASLTKLDASGWHLNPTDLTKEQPQSVPGLTGPSSTHKIDVTIRHLDSEYLPAPYAPLSSSVGTNTWSWDPQTLAIVSTATNRAEATRGLNYSVQATEPEPDAFTFEKTAAGTPDDPDLYALPDDVPEQIISLTHSITGSRKNAVAQATAIQAWLRDTRRFHYSTTAPPGTGYNVLTNFLTDTHSGYCIHFASAMALMARIEGIPSRVSVGFLPGSQNGAQRLVKASQMHAWPELYFQNYGWVRFEPTAAVAQPPAWTVENPKRAAPSTAPQSPEANRSPSPSTSASSQASPAPSPDATSHDSDHGSGVPWTVIVWILVVMVLLCVPMLTRMVVRRWRLHRDDPDAFARGAWQEVQACWIDHGLPLAHATSRQQCQEMAGELPEQARGALERLCLLDERARYAPSIDLDERDRDKVVDDVDTVRDALAQQPSRRPHWLAVWMPTSLIRGSRR